MENPNTTVYGIFIDGMDLHEHQNDIVYIYNQCKKSLKLSDEFSEKIYVFDTNELDMMDEDMMQVDVKQNSIFISFLSNEIVNEEDERIKFLKCIKSYTCGITSYTCGITSYTVRTDLLKTIQRYTLSEIIEVVTKEREDAKREELEQAKLEREQAKLEREQEKQRIKAEKIRIQNEIDSISQETKYHIETMANKSPYVFSKMVEKGTLERDGTIPPYIFEMLRKETKKQVNREKTPRYKIREAQHQKTLEAIEERDEKNKYKGGKKKSKKSKKSNKSNKSKKSKKANKSKKSNK